MSGAAGVDRKGGEMSVCDTLRKFDEWRRKERSLVVVDGGRGERLLGRTARGFDGERGLDVLVAEGVGGIGTAAASATGVDV